MRPPRANMRVSSIPPCRTSAISVVPPPMSMKMAPLSALAFVLRQRASAYGSATILTSVRSSPCATVSSAPSCISGAKALKRVSVKWRPLKPMGFVTTCPSMRTEMTAAFVKRTSIFWMPISSAIRSFAFASCFFCALEMRASNSSGVTALPGCWRCLVTVIELPFTSSPAIPITAAGATMPPAACSASTNASLQLAMTPGMSVTMPSDMWV